MLQTLQVEGLVVGPSVLAFQTSISFQEPLRAFLQLSSLHQQLLSVQRSGSFSANGFAWGSIMEQTKGAQRLQLGFEILIVVARISKILLAMKA